MGLLDEAIREHLELKRRRGTDPRVLAREEREALAPVPHHHDILGAEPAEDPIAYLPVADSPTEAHAVPTPAPFSLDEPPAGHLSASQETAELDMALVMGEDPPPWQHP